MVSMKSAGKLVIVLMLGVGLTAAGFTLWYHIRSGAQAMRYWGPDQALLIAQASRVEVRRLEPASDRTSQSEPTLSYFGRPLRVVEVAEATRARGLTNIRQTLLLDESFEWDQPLVANDLAWHCCLRFSDGTERLDILISEDGRAVVGAGLPRALAVEPEVASTLRSFTEEVLAAGGGSAGAPSTQRAP